MSASKTTISTSFFDGLWPAILEENVCNINSENSSKFFVPECKFDCLWAHSLLAAKSFGAYGKPLELNCLSASNKVPEESDGIADSVEAQQLPYRTPVPAIMPLDQQLAAIERDVKIRKKLAYDFANRTFPWYIQRPSYEYDFIITEEIRNRFQNPFEYEILNNIQIFQCNLMIIDVAEEVGLKKLERWLKFSPYVAIVAVIHNPELFRQIQNVYGGFRPVLMEDNLENSWQDELSRALEMGVQFARESYLFDNSSKSFVFVFANNRDICTCDKFKILRKS